MATVMGEGTDNDGEPDLHHVEISREDPESGVLTQTVCDCAWQQYRWDRTRPWKSLEGRVCSHLMAAYWKSRSTPIDTVEHPNYQVPVGQKAPAQMQIPLGVQPMKNDPLVQEPSSEQQTMGLPSTKDLITPALPNNPFTVPQRVKPGEKNVGQPDPSTPQREQFRLFDLAPAPLGPALPQVQSPVSVPGGTPPNPANPINIPGTFSKTAMAERSGDPELDALIEQFMKGGYNWEGASYDDTGWREDPSLDTYKGWSPVAELGDPGKAENMCDILSSAFVAFVHQNSKMPCEMVSMSDEEPDSAEWSEYGYTDRGPGWPYHAIVQITAPTGEYTVDFTAAQYGYTEFPMVQKQNPETWGPDAGKWERDWTSNVIPIIPVKSSNFITFTNDALIEYLNEQRLAGAPAYVFLTKPVTLELKGGKTPIPGAQPYDVSQEGVSMYEIMDLGWNPATQMREKATDNEVGGAPEWTGQYATAPTNKRAEVIDWDEGMKWAYINVPLNYPDGVDARLHAHSLAGWVNFSDIKALPGPAKTPFRQ